MNSSQRTSLCRHNLMGYCSNHFWKVMKASGKPGLEEYYCRRWRAKMEALDIYHQAVWRADQFNLTGEMRDRAIARELGKAEYPNGDCPDYRPQAQGPSNQCRYYYLETCLLTFPVCPGDCPDFLPQGDQR